VYPASFLDRLGNQDDPLGCHFWITFGSQMDSKMIHHAPSDRLECAAFLPIWANTPRTLEGRRVFPESLLGRPGNGNDQLGVTFGSLLVPKWTPKWFTMHPVTL